jgi:hypothetical protein
LTTNPTSIRPGEQWLDTNGNPIQAHGGSVIEEDGVFYWYGENKEHTTGDTDVWHWGVRCYSSTDLYAWEDRGLIIEPDLADPDSPLHPSQHLDRPHILRDTARNRYVCWIKVMGVGQSEEQTATVLVSDSLLGPYRVEHAFVKPQGFTMGDFDLATVGSDAVIFFAHPHTEVICSDLSDDLISAAGTVTHHFTNLSVPDSREAPAHFERNGRHYLLTSGTSGYFPNRSQIAVADSPHGPWQVLGDPHPADASGTSFRSQISSVFRHPRKKDLYIAVADRWLPERSPEDSDYTDLFRRYFAGEDSDELEALGARAEPDLEHANTSIARYVWLPIRFDGAIPRIDWTDEWSIDDID